MRTAALWQHPAFDNTTVLSDLASHSPALAAVVLANPHLTGPGRRAALSRAALTARAAEGLDLTHLTPADQADLVRAAAARSAAALDHLVPRLGVAAARTLLETTTPGSYKGAAAVIAALRESLSWSFWSERNVESDYAPLMDAALARFGGRTAAPPGMVVNWLAGLDADALPDAINGLDVDAFVGYVDEILALTAGRPDVSRRLADAGDLGVLVAASDHRQDPEFLTGLRLPGPYLHGHLDELRGTNPALDAGAAVRVSTNLVGELGEVAQDRRYTATLADVIADVESWLNRVKAVADMDAVRDVLSQMTTHPHAQVMLDAHEYGAPRTLLDIEAALNPHVTEYVNVDRRAVPGWARAAIVERLQPHAEDDEDATLAPADANFFQVLHHGPDALAAAATWLARTLTNGRQAVALETIAERSLFNGSLAAHARLVVEAHPTTTAAAVDYADLLGDPLR